ncbi:MAG: hypothetical protein COW24_03590 [Candidatus Kerfeldbacteria bacterium CG15_BIG_FIL_POST_REV_8_21_14_020_45_12]|uniref:Methyltransferase domain-containing protein n=1 Tax=Candidatus Kerfeldbacteria bacterium CG15_BIG_FIL_POST_REV_8_21_14_020_45_12 TaxID=2014247 RepID=A0A2M7H3E0_9BACT|nr:MAG: hypothetical protein COW24_03590 [Candidatus Kerfeldbacteria bacterium CG15_BIG_FIL_POST_REV_8_21_14_020_45_12]PJA93752.1 MAG: hypothetical protein CO132_01785 [Candidatus Kerfeldbacteria bacterium CG_4_9_14_3_um_filter_45_8]
MNKLDEIAHYYKIEDDFDMVYMQHNFIVAQDYFVGEKFLELGCATGESTLASMHFAKQIDVVEGSPVNIDITKKKVEAQNMPAVTVNFQEAYWEDFSFEENSYSDVLFFRGLEHLKDPAPVMKNIFKALKPGGRCHIVVPNANSLHRKIGVNMGLLKEVHELNDRDKSVGHERVFDLYTLLETVKSFDFEVVDWRGVMLKVLSNGQMQELCKDNENLIKGFFEVGKELPDRCAELYMAITPKK